MRKNKGWRHEPVRHGLASRGISTKIQSINHKNINDNYNLQLNSFQTVKLPDGSKIVIKSVEALSEELGSGKYVYGIVERVKDDEVTHRFRTKIYPRGLDESWSKVDVQIDNRVSEIMNELGYNSEIIKSDKYRSLGRKNSDELEKFVSEEESKWKSGGETIGNIHCIPGIGDLSKSHLDELESKLKEAGLEGVELKHRKFKVDNEVKHIYDIEVDDWSKVDMKKIENIENIYDEGQGELHINKKVKK